MSVLAFTTTGFSAEPAPDIFAYDRTVPLNVQEVGRETRGGAVVRDLTFTPAGAPGPHAAILYVHWLG